jgi:hypothetical protein
MKRHSNNQQRMSSCNRTVVDVDLLEQLTRLVRGSSFFLFSSRSKADVVEFPAVESCIRLDFSTFTNGGGGCSSKPNHLQMAEYSKAA